MATGRHTSSGSGKKAALIIGIVVGVLAIGAVAFAVFGGSSPIPGLGSDPVDDSVPEFSFHTKRVQGVVTAFEAKDKEAGGPEVKGAANDAAAVLSTFYREAFLDPENWRSGTYGEDVFGSFTPTVRPEAEAQADTLTAGSLGGDLESIKPRKSSLSARVLLDDAGEPYSVVVTVVFRARGQGSQPVALSSTGRYFFLRGEDGNWQISAFDVTRDVKEGKPGGGKGSASPTTGETEGAA